MIRFYRTPWITKMLYPSLIWNIPSENSIFLTFDDGPHPEITNWVLEELSKHDAHATFFLLGKNVSKHPELVKKTQAHGHKIGNHTYSHLKGWTTDDEMYLKDFKRCAKELNEFEGGNNLFRPPYGRIKKSQIDKLKNERIIMWSKLSWDFVSDLNIAESIRQLKKSKPGDILVFHENEKSFNNLKILLPRLLDFFNSKGYKLDTI